MNRAISAIVALLAFGSAITPAFSGEVEVTLKNRDGQPISGQRLSLRPDTSDRFRRYSLIRDVTTNAAGEALFGDVPPGSYKVDVGSLEGTDFVDPEENPFAPTPAVTLVDSSDRAKIELELWRGVRVVSNIRVDRGAEPTVTVHHHSIEAGVEYSGGTYPTGFVEKMLVPGQWRIAVEPPQGYLLTDLEIDGRPHEGHEPVMTLEEYMPTVHVTWYYSAPATLAGKVTIVGMEDGPLVIRADLIEPGPWIEAARKRGGSKVDSVETGLEPDDTYEMILPSGLWFVRPMGDRLASSDPESVELRLESGDYRRADFAVTHDPSDGGKLWVRVEDPDGARVAEAIVEVWSADLEGNPDTLLAEGKTEPPFPMARFSGLPEGNLLVVAGHPDFIETRLRVDDFDPDEKRPRSVTLKLDRGASVWARALDENERQIRDVILEVHRLEELPELLLEDPGFRQSKIDSSSRSDTTGYAEVSGLYPGQYRVTGRLLGSQAVTRFVRVGTEAGKLSDDAEVALGPRTSLEMRLVVLPAASVFGSIVCHDGGPFPPGASVRIFESGAPGGDPRTDGDLREGASVALDEIPLKGRRLDEFLAGPMESGNYQVAVRPTGFGMWTWAMGDEQRVRAAQLHVTIGKPSEIGLMSMECGPVTEFLFAVSDESPVPDIRDATVSASVIPLLGNPEREPMEPRIEQRRDSVLLRDLPEGEIEIHLSVEHPYFLPSPVVEKTLETELHRGWLDDELVVLEAVGGAVQFKGSAGRVRLHPPAPEGAPREQVLERGRTLFKSVPAGTYRLELCDADGCGGEGRQWSGVDVRAGRTTFAP